MFLSGGEGGLFFRFGIWVNAGLRSGSSDVSLLLLLEEPGGGLGVQVQSSYLFDVGLQWGRGAQAVKNERDDRRRARGEEPCRAEEIPGNRWGRKELGRGIRWGGGWRFPHLANLIPAVRPRHDARRGQQLDGVPEETERRGWVKGGSLEGRAAPERVLKMQQRMEKQHQMLARGAGPRGKINIR